jgi:hypothetical protein
MGLKTESVKSYSTESDSGCYWDLALKRVSSLASVTVFVKAANSDLESKTESNSPSETAWTMAYSTDSGSKKVSNSA